MLSARCAARRSSPQRGKAKGMGWPRVRASERTGSQRHRRDVLLKVEKSLLKDQEASQQKGVLRSKLRSPSVGWSAAPPSAGADLLLGTTLMPRARPGFTPKPADHPTWDGWLARRIPQEPTVLPAPPTLRGGSLPRREWAGGSLCPAPVLASSGGSWCQNATSRAGHSAGSSKHIQTDQYFERAWGPAVKRKPLVSSSIN